MNEPPRRHELYVRIYLDTVRSLLVRLKGSYYFKNGLPRQKTEEAAI